MPTYRAITPNTRRELHNLLAELTHYADCGVVAWESMARKSMHILNLIDAKKTPPKPLRGKTRKQEKKESKAERWQRVQDIREEVWLRSEDRCENPDCGDSLPGHENGELDHWLGGNGRRRQQESVETTWRLCPNCHRDKTFNRDVKRWNDRWRRHCESYGFKYQPHRVFGVDK